MSEEFRQACYLLLAYEQTIKMLNTIPDTERSGYHESLLISLRMAYRRILIGGIMDRHLTEREWVSMCAYLFDQDK